MDVLKPMLIVASLMAAATPASAHVAIQPQTTAAGAYQVLRFSVGHGCGAAATTELRIELPPAIQTARPQPKPGWTVAVDRDGESSRAVVWRGGPLPADQFDEFLILVRAPTEAADLAFPAIQACGDQTIRWVEPTPPGGPRPRQPAPRLKVLPPASTSAPPAPMPNAPSQNADEHRH